MLQTWEECISYIKQDVLCQEVKGTHVNASYKGHSLFIFILSVINILFGILFTYLYYSLYETKLAYDSSGSYSVFLPEGSINFYIQIEDFYQSHLRNSRSISHKQLEGKKDVESKKTSPLDYENDIPIYPAGILSNTFFQDTFEIPKIDIETDDISWSSNIKNAGYQRNEVVPPPLWEGYREIPKLYENKRYVNWIYNAPYYSFRKLWGKIEVLESGNYMLNIESVSKFEKKSVVFSQTCWAGNKNYFLSSSMIVVGIVGLLVSLAMYL
ncbi:putative ALA-interacting subunit 4 [Nosema granulosis]|uniref:ALA-interacting subunit 4 n=1 Tax=Nosema granulosis TaxID=83296 RepID=A0A9P6GZF5_9MICR|nr:putative ALA-interacting subunit 4 [Nosema granulosis]